MQTGSCIGRTPITGSEAENRSFYWLRANNTQASDPIPQTRRITFKFSDLSAYSISIASDTAI
jgi:hypothetical protein